MHLSVKFHDSGWMINTLKNLIYFKSKLFWCANQLVGILAPSLWPKLCQIPLPRRREDKCSVPLCCTEFVRPRGVCHPVLYVPQTSFGNKKEAALIYTSLSFLHSNYRQIALATCRIWFLNWRPDSSFPHFFVSLAVAQSPGNSYSAWDKHSALPRS